jgi:hypothetical protein
MTTTPALIEAGDEYVNDTVKNQVSLVCQQVSMLSVIETDEQYELAGEYLKTCAKARSIIEAETKPAKDAAYKAWKTICDTIKRWCGPIEAAETHWRSIRKDYEQRTRPAQEPSSTMSVVRTLPKTSGIAQREHWKARPADENSLLTLVKAAARNPNAYLKFLMPNESVIAAEAKTLKTKFKVPGYVVELELIDVVRDK